VLRRIFPILHVLGMIVLVFGLSMLAPLLLSELTRDGAERAYDEAVLITIGAGLAMWLLSHHWRRELKMRDGILLVVLTWGLLPAFAALPLIIFSSSRPESTVAPVLPLLGVGGRQMFKAEMPTPMKDQKLTPRMAETAKGLWLVYVILTAACILVLWALGMSFFDAVVHAFSIMGLGGFSSHDASLGYFDSLPLEIAVGTFALIAGINFATHFAVLRGRSLRVYRHDPEIRWFLGFVLISGVALALLLWQRDVFLDFPSALRYAVFNTISVATTLGFATTDYGHWPFFAGLWLLFLCSFSTSAGSTGGGIKMMRAVLLYKQVYRELNKLIHPNAQIPLRLGEDIVPNKIVYAVLAFLFIYVATIVSLSFVLSFTGLDVLTAFSAVVACINNTGPGLGQVGPATTYAVLTDFQTSVCSFAMLLGRLELFTLLVVLTPAFWRR